MPNGEDKNWVRLCAALEGFFVRYGHWPTRLRIPGYAYEDFRHLFRPATLHRLLEQFEVLVDDAHFAVESDSGRRYDCMFEGFPDQRPSISAALWLGLHPDVDSDPAVEAVSPSSDERYDITIAGRRLFWLRPFEVVREVVRFMIHELGLPLGEVERLSGQRLWRPVEPETHAELLKEVPSAAFDASVDVSIANVIRNGEEGFLLLHDDRHWRNYRDVLYRLEATLPFGTISWKRSSLLPRQIIIDRLDLESTRPGRGRLPKQYRSPPERDRPLPNSYWVSAEALLAGEYPSAKDTDEGEAKLRRLLNFGVRCFIDLTHTSEKLANYGPMIVNDGTPRQAEHHRYPIPPAGVVDGLVLASVLDAIDDALARRLLVYLHDRGGLGRSAMVVGCHLTRRGLTGEEALEVLSRLVKPMPKSRERRAPETEEQRRMIRTWPDRDPQQRARAGRS